MQISDWAPNILSRAFKSRLLEEKAYSKTSWFQRVLLNLSITFRMDSALERENTFDVGKDELCSGDASAPTLDLCG